MNSTSIKTGLGIDTADNGGHTINMTNIKGQIEKGEHLSRRTEFQKGQTAPNKDKKFSEEWRKKLSESHKGQRAWNKGVHTKSNDALRIWREAGNKPHNWQGDNATYTAIHQWLIKNYGRPKLCEVCNITTAKRYEWANISGVHKRNRDFYKRMCKKCHNDYDGVNVWQQKVK